MCRRHHLSSLLSRILLVASAIFFCLSKTEKSTLLFGADSDESVEVVDDKVDLVSESGPLSFSRVYVPSGRLSDIIRDENRYIPMAAEDFENAVQQRSQFGNRLSADLPKPVVEHVLYEMKIDNSGALVGDVSIWFQSQGKRVEVSPGMANFQDIFWRNETGQRIDWLQASAGMNLKKDSSLQEDVAVDFVGKPNGSIELGVPGTGRLFAKIRVTPTRSDRSPVQGASAHDGQSSFKFPRIPALATTLVLDLPRNVMPLIAGNEPTTIRDVLGESGSGESARWRYLIGPRKLLNLTLSNRRVGRCSCWSTISIGERNAEIETVILPETVWLERSLRLVAGKQTTVLGARYQVINASQVVRKQVDVQEDSGGIVNLVLPAILIGSSAKIAIRGIVTGVHQNDKRLLLPGLCLNQEQWVSGGFIIDVEKNLQISGVEIDKCIAIAPEESREWPSGINIKSQTAYDAESPRDDVGFVFEQQESDGSCNVTVAKRRPEFDVARVTTIDVSSASLIGRAACDIRVRRGNLHRITGRIGKQWFIDSVEPLVSEKATFQPSKGAGGIALSDQQSDVSNVLGETYDWKVVRSKERDQFVLELPRAVQGGENLRLRITGHRRGVVAGARIRSLDVDMIQFASEASEQVWMDLRTSPETTLVQIGDTKDELLFDPRVMPLTESGVWRQRVAVGRLAAPKEFRFLRSRPPLEVIAQSQFTVRGNRVSETYSFLCQAIQGELDAVTVHFSEPVGNLDWSILTDGQTTAIARRLNLDESTGGQENGRGEKGSTQRSVKESWLVELNPPVTGSTTLRATGERDFMKRTAIPLAWVASAVSPKGRISIQSAHESRPSVINHGLVQIPPAAGQLNLPIQTIMELRYDDAVLETPSTSVEILPGPYSVQSVARAWVWKETANIRCYTSGNAEYETTFFIENDGRQSVTVSLPEGHQLTGLEVQGESIPLRSSNVTECPVYLPSGRQKVAVAVQTTVAANYSRGLWELSSTVPAIDAPTLTRELQVVLPNNVRLIGVPFGYQEIHQQQIDWIEKLFGISRRDSLFVITNPRTLRSGFDSRRFVPTSGRYDSEPFICIDRWLLALVAIGFATLTATLAIFIFWKYTWLLIAGVVVASVATLWVPQPFDLVARANLWGMLAAAGFRIWLYGYATKKMSFALLLMSAFSTGCYGNSACCYGDEVPVQVFFTPIEGETTALVPEPLYKVLAGVGGKVQQSQLRILNSRIDLPMTSEVAMQGDKEVWYMKILVETDSAGSLLLDQSPVEGRFANEQFLLDGGTLNVSMPSDRSQAIISLPAGGRHSLVVPIEPVITRKGDVSFSEICLPNSPQTVVAISPLIAMSGFRNRSQEIQCEWSAGGRVFQPAQKINSLDVSQEMFRLPAAKRLRVIRAVDAKSTLTSLVRESQSTNRITWTPTDVFLVAEFTIDSRSSILPSFWIQADPRLHFEKNVEDENGSHAMHDFHVHSLGDGVYKVDQGVPIARETTCKFMFRLPSTNLAGKFELPYAWLRGSERDARETVLVPPEGTSVDVLFPGAVAPPQINELDSGGLQWFSERVGVGNSFSPARQAKDNPMNKLVSMDSLFQLQRQATFVKVVRDPLSLRGTQQIEINESAEKNHVVFEALIDASGTAWVKDRVYIPEGYQLESCKVFEKKNESTIAESEAPIDIAIKKKEGRNVYAIILQYPRTGIFLLRVEAASELPLPRRGGLPLVRSSSAHEFPYAVIWRGIVQRKNIQVCSDREILGTGAVQETGAVQQAGDYDTGVLLDLRAVEGDSNNVWRVELPSNEIQWLYRSEVDAKPSVVKSGQSTDTKDTPESSDDVNSSITSQLVDVEVLVDERGRIAGVCRIELPMSSTEARVRIPSGFRVFEMLLDGRQVQPKTPKHDSALQIWTVPIGRSSWPHELVIVFVAEFDSETMQGEPVSLALPDVAGIPVEQVLWTINYPVNQSLIFAGPGAVLSGEKARDIRVKVEAEIDAVFDKLTRTRPEDVVSRLQEFRLVRQKQAGVAPLEAWVGGVPNTGGVGVIERKFTSAFLPNNRWGKLIVKPQINQGTVTIRFATPRLSAVGRGVTTMLIVIAGAWFWWAITKFAGLILEIADRWLPAIAGVAAIGWIIYREPIWPGCMLLVVCLGAAISRLIRWHVVGPDRGSLVADQPTVAYGVSHPVAASSITRVASKVHESSTITHHIPPRNMRRDT